MGSQNRGQHASDSKCHELRSLVAARRKHSTIRSFLFYVAEGPREEAF